MLLHVPSSPIQNQTQPSHLQPSIHDVPPPQLEIIVFHKDFLYLALYLSSKLDVDLG